MYDTSPHNLFPLVFESLLSDGTPRIYGNDYRTADGTNVRDFVHVAHVADAHVQTAERLVANERVEPAYNLGSQNGLSVREIMNAMARVTGSISPRDRASPPR